MAIGPGEPSISRQALDGRSVFGLQPGNIRTLNDSTEAPAKLLTLAWDFHRYRLSILCLQETSPEALATWQLRDAICTFLAHIMGRLHGGVGIMVNEDVNKGLISISNHSKRLISAQFQMGENKLHVISAYAPTEEATDEEKQAFHDALQTVIEQVPSRDTLVIGGEFNAQVGGESPELWEGHLGKFARPRERCTDNGHRLLTACVSNDLVIRSMFFRHQMRHRVT